MMFFVLLLCFILGVATVIALEAVGIWLLISRLNRKLERQNETEPIGSLTDPNPSLHDKQGELWLLEPEKVPKIGPEDNAPTEQKKRKDILEVTPVRKHARIKDHCLILTETDGPCPEIPLRGCTVVAVSATNLSSRKWAKRYPIKVERKDSAIYRGHKVIYIYLETSWEKESWCKALRLASCTDDEKKLWFSKLSMDFQNYLAKLNSGYPSFMKPHGTLGSELMDKSVKFDNSSSKVRQFIKKLGRKASRNGNGNGNGNEYKSSGIQNHEDRKLAERSRSFQDSVLTNCIVKMGPTGKPPTVFSDDASVTSSVSTSADTESDYKNSDEGALCFNLLISRIFFDAKNNQQIVRSIQDRIQRTLSNMRIPSYIGGVNCTAVDPGVLPPRILAMRVLPSDMNEVWALEIDVEYSGDAILDIETRLEIKELDLEGNEAHLDTNTADEVTSDLLEEFEYIGEQLKLSDKTVDEVRQKDRDEKETLKSVAGVPSQVPKWKSVLHSITKQVSQVPFSLGIKISSLRGTLRLTMKPPPSDQIWLAFSSMPDIEFNLESHVGDCKITSGHLALFLINKFKAGIRETLVLPNRESITIPWMLAEKDDWVPRKVAPFMWYTSNQETSTNSVKRVNSSHRRPQVSPEKSKSAGHTPQLTPSASSLSVVDESRTKNGSFDELLNPLMRNDILATIGKEDKPDISISSRSLASSEGQVHSSEDEDSKLRKIGPRERMRGLGKKMGEKLEVKRRQVEEKGRSLVERMREGSMKTN